MGAPNQYEGTIRARPEKPRMLEGGEKHMGSVPGERDLHPGRRSS